MLRRLVDEKRSRLLVEAAAIAAVVPVKTWPPLVRDTRGQRWLDGYPAELRGALTHLAAADPDAVSEPAETVKPVADAPLSAAAADGFSK